MKSIKAFLFFSILMIFAGNSFAQNDGVKNEKEDSKSNEPVREDPWVYIGESKDMKVYINKDSTVKQGEDKKYFDFWLKFQCVSECNDGYKPISFSIQNWNIYCESSEYNVPSITDYYTDGDKNEYTNKTISPIMPDSPGEKIFNYICKKK